MNQNPSDSFHQLIQYFIKNSVKFINKNNTVVDFK